MTESAQPPVFWRQPAAERTLKQAAAVSRLSRAYLLVGPDGVGKWAAAQWLAQTLLCRQDNVRQRPCGTCEGCRRVATGTHPDWHALFPVPSSTAEEDAAAFLAAKRDDPFAVVRFKKRPYLGMERIRDLITELNKTSVEGGRKVALIASAEQMAGESQTILLKTIEEPPPDAHFILTSADPGRLLPTVVSRCQMVRFHPVDPAYIAERLIAERGLDTDRAHLVAELSGGGWGNALRQAGDDAETWRHLMLEFWKGAFAVGTGELLTQIDGTFRPRGRGVGFDLLLQAFDVWGLCLRRDCERSVAGDVRADRQRLPGASVPDLETGWTCWRILQNGRSTLYVNVAERHAIAGTFLALREQLRIP
ncbi:MAG: hypothetical protein HY304_03910 [candidate division Zixibacteria bacterium]|nr:hypothetical protein [candidate division Zixibacteria bacterium]